MDTQLRNMSEDAELPECDGEKVVTMMDVLQEQEDFEEDANAVLGASDDKNCTYSKGYIKRQAIYACMTCCSDAKDDPTKRAGVCLACSLVCHENHDLIELYTKRNFKCDCGNPKFNSHPCQFTPNKTDLNEENNYNHNFSGIYCVCQRPYPDPESTVDVEMIQCIICEDWLHATHLEATVPDNEQYSEMICKGCMEKNDFLHDYSNLAVNVDVDVVSNGIDIDDKLCNGNANLKIIKSETVNDVEMAEKADINGSSNITSDEETTEVTTNGDCTSENRDDEKIDTPMDTDETNVDAKKTELDNEENITSVGINDNVLQETVKDTNQEQHNETKELTSNTKQTEYDVQTENTEKSAEQLEEEQLLADSDENKISNSEPNDEECMTMPITESKAKEEQNNKVNEEKHNEANEKQNNKVGEEQNNELNEEQHKEDDEKEHRKVNEELNNEVDNKKQSEVNEEKHNEVDEKMQSEDNEEQYNEVSEEQYNEVNEEQHNEVNEEQHNIGNEKQNSEANEEQLNEVSEGEKRCDESLSNAGTALMESKDTVINSECHNGEIDVANEDKITEKRKLSTENTPDINTKKAKLDEANEQCVRPKGVHKSYKGSTFWPSTFRQKLCTCTECITMYKDLSVLFLIDPEDTVTEYENLGKLKSDGKPATQYEKGLQALSSLDRIQQINALTEYNKMRDKLLDFLKSFKDRRQVVTEDDIREFFAGMKPKREPDGVYFCR